MCGERIEKPHQQVIACILVSFLPPQMPSKDTKNPANENRRYPRALVTPKSDQLLPASRSAFSLLPALSELGYSCTALPSQVDASSNANSVYFYYHYLKSPVSLRKCSNAFALFRPLGLQEHWGGRITSCWKEKKTTGLLKLTHSTRVNGKALASPRTD